MKAQTVLVSGFHRSAACQDARDKEKAPQARGQFHSNRKREQPAPDVARESRRRAAPRPGGSDPAGAPFPRAPQAKGPVRWSG